MEILEVTVENFDEKVLNSEKPVMLDFWATWCGPCQMQAPIFHAFAEKHADTAVFGKVNVDEQMELAREFAVARSQVQVRYLSYLFHGRGHSCKSVPRFSQALILEYPYRYLLQRYILFLRGLSSQS